MWARDLLPKSLETSRYKGRYWTCGSPAGLSDGGRSKLDIHETAEDLLEQISIERGQVGSDDHPGEVELRSYRAARNQYSSSVTVLVAWLSLRSVAPILHGQY
jgi:hypothetical protein